MSVQSSTLIFFQAGTSNHLVELIRRTSGDVAVFPLRNATSDRRFLHDVVAESSPRARIFDLHSALGKGDRYRHLDDYIEIVNAWSRNVRPSTGLNLRQSLAFDGEISAWWLLAFTEKATGSESVEVFKAIAAVRDCAATFDSVVFLGDSSAARPYALVARGFGWRFSVEIPAAVEAETVRAESNGSFTEVVRNLRARREIPNPPPEAIVLLSDYPMAWSGTSDRYLSDVGAAIEARFPGRLHTVLKLGLGSVFARGSARALGRAFRFRSTVRERNSSLSLDILDAWNGNFVRLRAKLWAWMRRRALSRALARREFGKIEYLGIDLTEYFNHEILTGLRARIPGLLAEGIETSRYLRRIRAKLCFYRNEFYCYGRIHSWACARAGIPGFGVQHGVINSKYGVYQFDDSEIPRDFFRPDMVNAMPSPTRFGLWGKWYRDRITESSRYPAEALPVIGAERILSMRDRVEGAEDRAHLKRQMGARAEGDFVLLFTVQDAKTLEAVALVINGVAGYRGPGRIALALKLHPLHAEAMRPAIDGLLAHLPGMSVHFVAGDLGPMVHAADAVITAFSATGIEALLLGRPLITVQIPTIAGDPSFRDFSAEAYEVSTVDELRETLAKFIDRRLRRTPEYFVRPGQTVLATDRAESRQVLYREVEALLGAHVTLKSERPRPKPSAVK